MTVTRDLPEKFDIRLFGRVYLEEALAQADGLKIYSDYNCVVAEIASAKMLLVKGNMSADHVRHLRSFFDAVLFGDDYLMVVGEDQYVGSNPKISLGAGEIGKLADEIIDAHETDLKVAVNYLQGKPNGHRKYHSGVPKDLSKDS